MGHYREISDQGLDVLTDSEVNTPRSRSEISLFYVNDRTDEVYKLFFIWPFHHDLSLRPIKTNNWPAKNSQSKARTIIAI